MVSKDEISIIDINLIEEEALWPKVSVIPKNDGSLISMPIEDMNPLLKLKELKDALGFDLEIVKASYDAREK